MQVQIYDILVIAKEHEQILRGKKLMTQICDADQEKPMKNSVQHDLRVLHDWTLEQKRDLPAILNERKRIIELNLKLNSLV